MPLLADPPKGDALVSIVITCFNHGRFLGEAIESARRQTYPDVEIVVVDDGSTDDTQAVAAQYPSVRTVWQRNSGLSAARNTGIREAGGQYVIFLDADDLLRPNAVEAGLACFATHPDSAFVSGDHIRIAADGSFLAPHIPYGEELEPYVRLLQGNFIGMHATVMYRREALVAIGGFDTTLAACEDYDIYLRIAREAPVASHSAVTAEYRMHGDNMSHNAALMLETALCVLRRQHIYVQKDPQREAAYQDGIAFWTDYYGSQMMKQLMASLRTGAPLQAARLTGTLVRHAPHVLLQKGPRLMLRKVVPYSVRVRLRRLLMGTHAEPPPPPGHVRFGNLRRLTPISRSFGFDRGTPIDRYYIEQFLQHHARDVKGRTLEIGDDSYTRQFGGARVETADVLHVHADNPRATFVGDLTHAETLPSDAFDCIILTQTLHLIYELDAAVETLHRVLKPGGVLLATVPGISQIENGEWRSTWYWSFTPLSVQRLFGARFAEGTLSVAAQGNVLASISFLHGIATEELEPAELEPCDPLYPMLITIRAQKAPAAL